VSETRIVVVGERPEESLPLGEIAEALSHYRRALELARHDPDLEETVERMEKELAPPAAAEPEVSIEALFDFDRLVEQLGAETPPGVVALDAMREGPVATPATAASPGPVTVADHDPFANLEAGLRAHESQGAPPEAPQDAGPPAPDDTEALVELEHWLEALRTAPR